MTRIERYKQDIKALENEYGKLEEGTDLTIDLLELGALCPRKYNQTKAYAGLIGFIRRTRKASVKITSQLNKGEKNDED